MKKLLIALLFSVGLQAQTMDFKCIDLADPFHYYDMFIEEALTYGHDFRDQTGTITLVPANWLPNISAVSINSCSDGYHIEINSEIWVRFHDLYEADQEGRGVRWRKRLIYHELGHALLERDHTCDVFKRSSGGFAQVFQDIMFSPTKCTENYVLLVYPWVSDSQFNKASKRLFENTGQQQLSNDNCGYTGKGDHIIYD